METKIDNILEGYDIAAPERTVRKISAEVVNELLDTNLTVDDISYRQGSIWIDTDPLIRSQVHLQKQKIQESISERLDNRSISDLH